MLSQLILMWILESTFNSLLWEIKDFSTFTVLRLPTRCFNATKLRILHQNLKTLTSHQWASQISLTIKDFTRSSLALMTVQCKPMTPMLTSSLMLALRSGWSVARSDTQDPTTTLLWSPAPQAPSVASMFLSSTCSLRITNRWLYSVLTVQSSL